MPYAARAIFDPPFVEASRTELWVASERLSNADAAVRAAVKFFSPEPWFRAVDPDQVFLQLDPGTNINRRNPAGFLEWKSSGPPISMHFVTTRRTRKQKKKSATSATTTTKIKKTCGCCGEQYEREAFSSRQWRGDSHTCVSCIDKARELAADNKEKKVKR